MTRSFLGSEVPGWFLQLLLEYFKTPCHCALCCSILIFSHPGFSFGSQIFVIICSVLVFLSSSQKLKVFQHYLFYHTKKLIFYQPVQTRFFCRVNIFIWKFGLNIKILLLVITYKPTLIWLTMLMATLLKVFCVYNIFGIGSVNRSLKYCHRRKTGDVTDLQVHSFVSSTTYQSSAKRAFQEASFNSTMLVTPFTCFRNCCSCPFAFKYS